MQDQKAYHKDLDEAYNDLWASDAVLIPATRTLVCLTSDLVSVLIERRPATARTPYPPTVLVARRAAAASRIFSAQEIRARFLAVRDISEAMDFIGNVGFIRDPGSHGSPEQVISFETFSILQRLVRLGMEHGQLRSHRLKSGQVFTEPHYASCELPEEILSFLTSAESEITESEISWLRLSFTRFLPEPGHDSADGRFELRMVYPANSVLEACLALCFVEQRVGIFYKECALPDCSVMFTLTSKQPRLYCTPAHAHKAAIRKSRQVSAT